MYFEGPQSFVPLLKTVHFLFRTVHCIVHYVGLITIKFSPGLHGNTFIALPLKTWIKPVIAGLTSTLTITNETSSPTEFTTVCETRLWNKGLTCAPLAYRRGRWWAYCVSAVICASVNELTVMLHFLNPSTGDVFTKPYGLSLSRSKLIPSSCFPGMSWKSHARLLWFITCSDWLVVGVNIWLFYIISRTNREKSILIK